MTQDEIEAAGRALSESRKLGTLADLRLDRVRTQEDAEAVQAAAAAASGRAPIGYHVQAMSVVTRRQLCSDEPMFGTLLDGDLLSSPGAFRLPRGVIGAGCGLLFVIGRPFPLESERVSRDGVASAITACRPMIELIGRRVRGSLPLNTWTATADFALHVLTVQGAAIKNWRDVDLAAMRASARLNGQTVGSGSGADVMGHPFEAVAWLADALFARERELEAGEFVTTGSFVGLMQVMPGQTFEADFGENGRVELSFT